MTSPPDGSDRRNLRASDLDRERTAEILRDAAGDGRLGLDELDERLTAVYAAKTYAELEPIVQDLPHSGVTSAIAPVAEPDSAPVDRFGGEPASHVAVGIMGGFSRKGAWVVPKNFAALAFMGGGELDLRDARFADRVVKIRAMAIMGGVSIIVPDDADVQITGIGLMGGFGHSATGAGQSGAPAIIVSGLAFWGGVNVKRKLSKAARQQRRLEARKAREPLPHPDP